MFFVGGIDEAGRGPLAGPVVAAAVVLDPAVEIIGLDDSKKLKEHDRERLYSEISAKALSFAVAMIGPRDIERINIRQATLKAMELAAQEVERRLSQRIFFLIDGNMPLGSEFLSEAVVKGDQKFAAISAASILAKVTRDREMQRLHALFPQYDFQSHKGYPTPSHLHLIQQHGPSEVHRRTFAGVKEHISKGL